MFYSNTNVLLRSLLFSLIIALPLIFFDSCSSVRHAVKKDREKEDDKKVDLVVKEAMKYLHTRYKPGGIDKDGIDCSGLIMIAYQKADIKLPRTAGAQSTFGKSVKLSEVKRGDLLFFETAGKSKGISHVGLVTEVDEANTVFFIHASTKLGVTINNLTEKYYKDAFVKIMRPN